MPAPHTVLHTAPHTPLHTALLRLAHAANQCAVSGVQSELLAEKTAHPECGIGKRGAGPREAVFFRAFRSFQLFNARGLYFPDSQAPPPLAPFWLIPPRVRERVNLCVLPRQSQQLAARDARGRVSVKCL